MGAFEDSTIYRSDGVLLWKPAAFPFLASVLMASLAATFREGSIFQPTPLAPGNVYRLGVGHPVGVTDPSDPIWLAGYVVALELSRKRWVYLDRGIIEPSSVDVLMWGNPFPVAEPSNVTPNRPDEPLWSPPGQPVEPSGAYLMPPVDLSELATFAKYLPSPKAPRFGCLRELSGKCVPIGAKRVAPLAMSVGVIAWLLSGR